MLHSTLFRRAALAGVTLAAAVVVVTPAPPSGAAPSSSAHPVTLTNCGGGSVTFDKAPSRVLSTAPDITEDLLALGLTSRLIGDFGGTLPVSGFVSQYDSVTKLPTTVFTPEKIVGLQPDFVFAGWGYGFEPSTTLTPRTLATEGIKSLVLTGSCPNADSNSTNVQIAEANNIDSTYADLRNLGKIFNVRHRATTLIAKLKKTVSTAHDKVVGLKPVSVMLYNNGTSAPGTAAGLSTPNGLIKLAGGSNIFASLQQDYTTVSWEQVVTADPRCIIIKNGTDAGIFGPQEETFLKTSSVTKNLTAVKRNCFLILNQDELTPGVLNASAVVSIAHWLHPAAFGLPADGA